MITFTKEPWGNPGLERVLKADGWRVIVRGRYIKAKKPLNGRRNRRLICGGYDYHTGLYFVGYADSDRLYLHNFLDSPSGKRGFHRFFYGQLMHDAGIENSRTF